MSNGLFWLVKIIVICWPLQSKPIYSGLNKHSIFTHLFEDAARIISFNNWTRLSLAVMQLYVNA